MKNAMMNFQASAELGNSKAMQIMGVCKLFDNNLEIALEHQQIYVLLKHGMHLDSIISKKTQKMLKKPSNALKRPFLWGIHWQVRVLRLDMKQEMGSQ